jgi:hypothetical protein
MVASAIANDCWICVSSSCTISSCLFGKQMNDQIKDIAYEAGFHLQEHDEEGAAPYGTIVWASHYDDELVKFTHLVAQRCAYIAAMMERDGRKNIGAAILDHFEVPLE